MFLTCPWKSQIKPSTLLPRTTLLCSNAGPLVRAENARRNVSHRRRVESRRWPERDAPLGKRSGKPGIGRTLVQMVHSLGIVSVAEGVETQAESETCLKMGFDLGQGFF
jgi:hypothetical protein